MKAIRIHCFGGPECLQIDEMLEPQIRVGEVLIKVHAAGVNPVDTKIRAGKFARFYPVLPATLGRDVSGTVARVGPQGGDFRVGDEVFALLDYDRGGYAEYVAASAREIAAKPSGLSHIEAAALPVAALTAWQALFEHGKLDSGQKVLILGAAGGVGHFAVQLAAWCGAKVSATCSKEDLSFVTQLGAAQAFDYKGAPFEDLVSEVNLVIDLISGETRQRAWKTLKPGGILASTLPDPKPFGRSDVSGREVVLYPSGRQLSEIGSLVVQGRIKGMVDRVFPFANGAGAHAHLEHGHSRGKTVLKLV